MKKIYLFCSAGMSTSMLASNMQSVANAHNLPIKVAAFSHNKLEEIIEKDTPDCILLGPQISFVHSLTKCSESLQFDLADILKPVLIDRLVLSLCRHKSLKDEYFDYKKDRCYLNKKGVKFFVEKYENYLLKTIKINNKYYSYRNLISREVHLLSNYIANESNDYKPYIMKW